MTDTPDPFPLRGEVPDEQLPTLADWLAAGGPIREITHPSAFVRNHDGQVTP